MLRAVYEHGIAPDVIVGTSAGAVNGAYIASRPPTPDTATALEALWRQMSTFQVFPPNPVTAVLGLVGEHDYLISNDGVKRQIEAHAGFTRMEDAAIPFHVVATDVLSGQKVRISQRRRRVRGAGQRGDPGRVPLDRTRGPAPGRRRRGREHAARRRRGARRRHHLRTAHRRAVPARQARRGARSRCSCTRSACSSTSAWRPTSSATARSPGSSSSRPRAPRPSRRGTSARPPRSSSRVTRRPAEVLSGEQSEDYWRERALAHLRLAPHG